MGPDEGRWADAACRNATKKEQAYFFSEKGRPSKNPPFKRFCDTCPIRVFCLEYAIVHDEDGVWGGLTRKERERVVKSHPYLKDRLIKEAKKQGWFENRKSVDEILAPEFQKIESDPIEHHLVPLQQSTPLNLWAPLEELLPFPAVPVLPQQTSVYSYLSKCSCPMSIRAIPNPSVVSSEVFLAPLAFLGHEMSGLL